MPSKIQFAINPKIPIIASGSIRIPIPIHPHITQYSFFTISISFGSGCGAIILLACSVSSSCSSSTSFPICLKAALISSHNFFNVSPPNSLIKSVALSTVGSSFSISLLPHILQNFALASALIPHFGHIFTMIFPSFFCSIYLIFSLRIWDHFNRSSHCI